MTRWERLLRWEDTHRLVVDALVAGLVLLLFVPASADVLAPGASALGPWAPRVVTVLMVVPLAWRRVRPTAAAAVVYSVALLQVLFVTPLVFPADLAVLVALHSVTVHGPRWAHRVAIGGGLLGSGVLAVRLVGSLTSAAATGVAVLAASTMLTVWAFGLVRRSRRETVEALVDRARRLEVERDQQALIATAAERARIAREMHDIVAHSLTVVIAQADGGRYAAQADPTAATRALSTIGETGRAALTDMRRLLGVLRTEPSSAPGAASTPAGGFAPQPGAGDVAALVDQVRGSGTRVSLVRTGATRPLPPGMGLALYRIAQEALTNVLKHAGPDPQVTVHLGWRPDSVLVQVDDDGRGAAADVGPTPDAGASRDGSGHGLLGMRERATMFGGTLTAGPRPGGGFRVRAELPTPHERTTGPDGRVHSEGET